MRRQINTGLPNTRHVVKTINYGNIHKAKELVVDKDLNKVKTTFGDFTTEPATYKTMEDKLSYLVTMVAMTECYEITSSDNFYKAKGFLEFEDAIKDRYRCNGVYIDSDIGIREYTFTKPGTTEEFETIHHIVINGVIDHRYAQDKYDSLDDFLKDNNLTVSEFIFNPNIQLVIEET